MIQNISQQSESIILFSILLFFLHNSFESKVNRIKYELITFLTVFLFALCYKSVEARYGNLLSFCIILFLFAAVYCYLFQKGILWNKLIFISTFISAIICIKTTILCFAEIYGFKFMSEFSSLEPNVGQLALIYLSLYGSTIACGFFLVKHPLVLSKDFPAGYHSLIILCSISMILIVYFENKLFHFYNPLPVTSTLIFLFLFCIVLAIYYLMFLTSTIYIKIFTANRINERLRMENNNLKSSFSLIKHIRKEEHEIKNQYFYLSSLVKSKRYDELDSYLDTKLSYQHDVIENFNTGNQLVDFLLTQKISEARQHGIRVTANIIMTPKLPIKDEDFCSLLLNLIDNAIEASKKEPNPDIRIAISIVKNYLHIQIKNRVSDNILAINSNMQTTKADHINHGYGLQIVQTIVEKYNGMIKYDMINDYFSAVAMLELNCVTNA